MYRILIAFTIMYIGLLAPVKGAGAPGTTTLHYDLYFNWKFVWVKAGSAHYKTTTTTYQGKPALRTDLLFQSNKRCSAVFPMKDTLVSYTTPDLKPLYYRKGANEGKRYTVDEVWYTYPAGKCHLRQKYLDKHGVWSNHTHESVEQSYDMLSILSVARTFDTSNYTKGKRIYFPMTTGRKVEKQTLIYKGKDNFKANDGKTYRCLVFSLLDYESVKEKELLRFYVTDDSVHLPVRIDFYLKFGIAKAYFAKGA